MKKFIFKHKVSLIPTITLELYGDESDAWEYLAYYVSNTNDWKLETINL